MADQPIQVLIVDDHAMVRKGIKALLNEYKDIIVIGEAANGPSAINLFKQLKPDVVLMDLLMPGISGMPNMGGIEAIKRIIAFDPKARIIALTAFSQDDIFLQVIKSGAMGYLIKTVDCEDLVQSIKDVYAGKPSLDLKLAWRLLHGENGVETTQSTEVNLSNREVEILRLIAQGKTDQQIARELVLAEVTIRTHVSRVLMKLGVNNRVQAVLYGIRSGMVSLYGANELEG